MYTCDQPRSHLGRDDGMDLSGARETRRRRNTSNEAAGENKDDNERNVYIWEGVGTRRELEARERKKRKTTGRRRKKELTYAVYTSLQFKDQQINTRMFKKRRVRDENQTSIELRAIVA